MPPFIPKNAQKLLNSKALQREFFLKPYGLQTAKNANFPKQHPEYKFFQQKLVLHRPGIDPGQNTITFKTNPRYSKPELKQYIEKLYGLDIKKVNTARFMGKVKMSTQRRFKKQDDWKKVFVITNGEKIDPFLNQPI